jgi:hypothetical protein
MCLMSSSLEHDEIVLHDLFKGLLSFEAHPDGGRNSSARRNRQPIR